MVQSKLFATAVAYFLIVAACSGQEAAKPQWAEAANQLSGSSESDELPKSIRDQTWRNLRARGDAANQRDLTVWRTIDSREGWEKLRDEKLKRLRASLGTFPTQPTALSTRVTKTIEGDGFVIENIVFQTRPDFWVSANLYSPSKPGASMPGILIAHSHHRPKTQGELQDMGMTWARAGCVVLVIDQAGHGERADHPFQSEADYKVEDSGYRWWRQDYYSRFDTNTQLHLAGESLMGWLAYDLTRSVDLLLTRPGVDPKKIILLGAVAGGGDPAGVTAALDQRIAAAVPFNFGGPQPETRYPLPADADLHFNYLGGAYWEGTRNLRRTGTDGFFHWLIVASIAPRRLIYAHEFAWDRDHDPVWKRLNTIYEHYDSADHIDYTHGSGSVKGKAPESTHCTNIGKHHRQRIHLALNRWFNIRVTPDDEYSNRLDDEDLRSMRDSTRRELRPLKLHQVVARQTEEQLAEVRKQKAPLSSTDRRNAARSDWRALLGDINPRDAQKVVTQEKAVSADGMISVEHIRLQTEADIVIPLVLLTPNAKPKQPRDMVIAIAQAGKDAFLKHRTREIDELLAKGHAVCLPDLRETGVARGSHGNGPNSSTSHYALFFETPMLGYRVRDLRSVMKFLRTREDAPIGFALWGDSFSSPNPPGADLRIPRRVSNRPRFSEPMGGMAAMLAALFEDDTNAVYIRGGLSTFQSVASSPFVLIPHDVVVPGMLRKSDLPDLAAALAPTPLRMERLVDNGNQLQSIQHLRTDYAPAFAAYERNQKHAFSISDSLTSPAAWFHSLRPEK